MKQKPIAAVVTVLLLIVAVWGDQLLKPFRYHQRLDAAEVLRVEVLQRPGHYGVVSEVDQRLILSWYAEARFTGDHDDLAGPGCHFVDMFIYLKSGHRVAISDFGDNLEISRNKKHYFVEHPQLQAFIRAQKDQAGC